jgi:UDP-2-acetamido-3-amino-2,3-dideoxy-glucuronate N-acetyltransferase
MGRLQQVSTGLIGLGYWGKNLYRTLSGLGVLRIACDSDPSVVAAYRTNSAGRDGRAAGSSLPPPPHFTSSPDDLFCNRDIEAVAIATPAATHYALVRRALLEGKDVFVEKPLALTVDEGSELVEIAEKNRRILMVGHILQYHPAVRKLAELISSGGIGKVQYIYSNRLNIGKLRTEENILWSFAPHDISVLLMLLQEEPVAVHAFGGDYLNKGIFDTTLTTLEFSNGVKGHIFISWLHPFKEQKLIVVGSGGMVVFDDLTQEKLFFYPHKIEWKDGKFPVAQKAEHQVIPVERTEPLKQELIHFIACVSTRERPKTDGREGVRVLKILEAAGRAIGRNRTIACEEPPKAEMPEETSDPSGLCIHETACVDADVKIGRGARIWHFSHILSRSVIGEDCVIGQNVVLGPDVTVGNRCKIQNNVSVYKGVTLEDDVFCGPSCVFTNVYNPRAFIERKDEFRSTLVKRGATIGANATLLCGVTIGRYAFVAAGAVVRSEVPDYALVAGVPAKQIGWVCKCGTTLNFQSVRAVCAYCGNEYELSDNNGLSPGKGNR